MLPEPPEGQELKAKLAALEELETSLVARELEVSTLREGLLTFQLLYLREVGSRIAELENIRASLAELQSRQQPDAKDLQDEAVRARARAQLSSDEADRILGAAGPIQGRTEASEEIKSTFREIARRIHPDLSSNEEDRSLRTRFMARLNSAYQARDHLAMLGVLDECQNLPQSVVGEGVAHELVRTIRRLAGAVARLRQLSTEEAAITSSPIFELRERVAAARTRGRDLLKEMAFGLEEQIRVARETIEKMESSPPPEITREQRS